MSYNKNIIIKNLILFLILIILNFLFFFNYKKIVKNIQETQNNLNLNASISCLTKLNPKNEKEFLNDMNICSLKMRSLSPGGDMFVMKNNKKIIWDASVDCKLDPENSFLTKEKICSLFYDKKSCINGSNILINNKFGIFYWQFLDDSKELVSFKKYKNYIIAQGSIVKDVENLFLSFIVLLFIFDLLFLIKLKE